MGLTGKLQLAADIGIVQAAATALFLVFSGNARPFILHDDTGYLTRKILLTRLALIPILGFGAFVLGSTIAGVSWVLALVFTIRKAAEWIAEVRLCEAERREELQFAELDCILQIGLLMTSVAIVLWQPTLSTFTLFIWAAFPLVHSSFSLPTTLRNKCKKNGSASVISNIGSSAATGIGFYIFRLTLVLLAGKVIAGQLFTAFAIGGLIASTFTYSFGPSLVLLETRTGKSTIISRWVKIGFIAIPLVGLIAIFVPPLTYVLDGVQDPDEKELFWRAIGLSMFGGILMLKAQMNRLRYVHLCPGADIFAPDMAINLLIVVLLPVVYFVVGINGLPYLYLLNSIVAYFIYQGVRKRRNTLANHQRGQELVNWTISLLIVFPLFFTISNGLFVSNEYPYDSAGQLNRLPLPLSVLALSFGTLILLRYRSVGFGLVVTFTFLLAMVSSTVIGSSGVVIEQKAKLLLLVQYLVPFCAFPLGMIFSKTEIEQAILPKAMACMVVVIAPLQLAASWIQGSIKLSSFLYIFSIYQHHQYVPIIILSSYFIALSYLWKVEKWNFLMTLLAPLVGLYIAASASISAAILSILGAFVFVVVNIQFGCRNKMEKLLVLIAPIILVLSAALYNLWTMYGSWLGKSGGNIRVGPRGMYSEKITGSGFQNFKNANERMDIWSHYIDEIFSDSFSFAFGHSAPPLRGEFPSAHNYYLDIVYNFGIFPAIVVISLLLFTLYLLYSRRRMIAYLPELLCMAFVVLYLVGPENFIKVGMRQPYPGIFTYFLWGYLFSRLLDLEDGGDLDFNPIRIK